MSDPDWDDEWDDDDLDDDDVDEEDLLALHALAAAMEADGNDELARAQREAWVAISEEAIELKARRERRERRQATERRAAEQARREAEERAARQEAARVEAERRAEARAEEARRQARINAARRERAWRQEEARREEMRRRAEEQRRFEDEERRHMEAEERRAQERRRAQEEMRAEEERRREEERERVIEEERRARHEAHLAEQQEAEEEERRRMAQERRETAAQRGADAGDLDLGGPVVRPAVVAPPAATAANDSGSATPGRTAEEEPTRFPSRGDASRPLTGADLSRWRVRLDLTQQVAADRLGVRQGTVSKAESRADAPLGPTLREALAEQLDAERRSA